MIRHVAKGNNQEILAERIGRRAKRDTRSSVFIGLCSNTTFLWAALGRASLFGRAKVDGEF